VQTVSRVPDLLQLKAPTERTRPANLKNPPKDGSSNGTFEPYDPWWTQTQ